MPLVPIELQAILVCSSITIRLISPPINNSDKIGNFLFYSPHPRPASSHFSNFQGVQSDHLMRRQTQPFCYELYLSYKLINVVKNCFSILTSKCLLLLHRFPRPTSAKVKVKNGVDLHLESTLVFKSARNSWTLSLPTEARWPPWSLEELLLSKKRGYKVDISPARFFPIPPRRFCFANLVAFVRVPEE